MIKFDYNDIDSINFGTEPISKVLFQNTTIWEKANNYMYRYFTVVNNSYEDENKIYLQGGNSATGLSMSTNNGATWTTVTRGTNGLITTLTTEGEKLLLKANFSQESFTYDTYYTINSDYNISVEGNILSLWIGDDFIADPTGANTPLTSYCFSNLFFERTTLTNTENLILPSTTLASHCYENMFCGCTSLTTTPELPATTLAQYCYKSMFNGCTSLTTTPELPATTMFTSCYQDMFYGCTSLTTAPELPATTLATSCYAGMFSHSGVVIPMETLPATTLANNCYEQMFSYCPNLTKTPDLPATTGGNACYHGMFMHSPNLSYVKALMTNTGYNTYRWLEGVSATGTFVKDANATWSIGTGGIPSGWVYVDDVDYDADYLTFYSTTSNTCKFIPNNSNVVYYKRSSDADWILYDAGNEGVSINAFEPIKWKGNCIADSAGIGMIGCTQPFAVAGNIMSLIKGDDFENYSDLDMQDYMFQSLFRWGGIVDAQFLKLPTCNLSSYMYRYMFQGSTYLMHGPDIESDIIGIEACGSMFDGCTSLKEGIRIAATTFNSKACKNMYNNCTSLVKAPDFEMTTGLTYECFCYMFSGCSSLVKAPEIIAPSIAQRGSLAQMFINCTSLTTPPSTIPVIDSTNAPWACVEMFKGCTSLTTIPQLPSLLLSESCYSGMFNGCTSLTDLSGFVLPHTSLGNSTGSYEAMFYECTGLTDAPTLMMTVVGNNTCKNMFYGCTSLENAQQTFYFTDVLYNGCERMFRGCSSLVKAPDMPTSIVQGNYAMNEMFYDCSSMTQAPILPSGQMKEGCYMRMFVGCSSLVTGPDLPALWLATGCYNWMFWGCTLLNNIKCNAHDLSSNNSNDWLHDTVSNGTYYSNWADAPVVLPRNEHGIPASWTFVWIEN